MAELADAPDLGSGVYDVQVQVLLSASKIPGTVSTVSGIFSVKQCSVSCGRSPILGLFFCETCVFQIPDQLRTGTVWKIGEDFRLPRCLFVPVCAAQIRGENRSLF